MINAELYQQMILEHNKKPRNYGELPKYSHSAEGYNPLCGDHLWLYIDIDQHGLIEDISFKGEGCAISKASASMMTDYLKGKNKGQAREFFLQFQKMVKGQLNPESDQHDLGKLKIFAGIWQYPSRVKCAILAWHALHGALDNVKTVSTE